MILLQEAKHFLVDLFGWTTKHVGLRSRVDKVFVHGTIPIFVVFLFEQLKCKFFGINMKRMLQAFVANFNEPVERYMYAIKDAGQGLSPITSYEAAEIGVVAADHI